MNDLRSQTTHHHAAAVSGPSADLARTPRRWRRPSRSFGLVALTTGAALLGVACAPTPELPEPERQPVLPEVLPVPPEAAPAPQEAPPPAAGVPGGWALVGGDEFDGSSIDPTKWRAEHSNYGAGNAEQQCSTPANVTVGGGTATIWAKKETVHCPGSGTYHYTSGFLSSRDAGRYYPLFSRIEARIKVPHGQGLWPAVWLRHRNGAGVAEVDVMEYFHATEPGQFRQTLHFPRSPGYGTNWKHRAVDFEAPTDTPGWHTVAVEITPAGGSNVTFAFFVDGALNYAATVDASSWIGSAPADATWDLAVNQAIGGRWVGDPEGTLGWFRQLGLCSVTERSAAQGQCPTVGRNGQPIRLSAIASSAQPYQIDWIRVWVPA